MYKPFVSLKAYVLKVKHPGDWTELTEDSRVYAQELFSEYFSESNRLLEFFMVKGQRSEELRRIFRRIRERHDLLIYNNHNKREPFYFGVYGDFQTSYRWHIHTFGGLGSFLVVKEGLEEWYFYAIDDDAQQVYRSIPKKRLVEFHEVSIGWSKRLLNLNFVIKQRYLNVLRTGLQIGYFEYPRRSSLTSYASTLGIKKSSMTQLLRAALKEFLQTAITVSE